METEVLICGAGPSGLMLAIELARRGVPFLLIDKAPEPFSGSRGKGLQPRTLEILDMLGLAGRIAALGGPYPPLRIYAEDGSHRVSTAVAYRAPSPAEPFGGPLMLPQFMTEGVLREHLAGLGHAPRFGAELIAFRQGARDVRAKLRVDGRVETVRALYLVGADGGRSFVRRTLQTGFPGETLPVRAIVADVRLDGLSRDIWHRWGRDAESQVAVCPLMGTDLFQVQAPVPPEPEPDMSAAAIEQLVRARSGRADIHIREVTWASAWTCNARLAERYVQGRVMLMGDAAHVHPPTGGQGLNTSVQDAWNLGWKLAAVLRGGPDLLDTYESERRAAAADVLGLSMRLLAEAAANADLRRDRAAQQLDLGYPDSRLSLDGGGGRRLRAGDRAPDAPCRWVTGQPTRLFDLYGPYWTLLAFGAETPAARAGLRRHRVGAELIDADGHIAAAYDAAPGDLILIRPDGYVGARATDAAALDAYMDRVGLSAPRAFGGGCSREKQKETL